MLNLQMTGDWNKAGIHFRNLHVRLRPAFEAQFYEDGQFVLEKMKGHIYAQDLNWVPLAQRTVELKGGDSTIMIETGHLVEGLVCRRVKSTIKGSTIFVGASPWKRHKPSGVRMSDLMIWLEYGTDKMPPRPLIRPTYEEVESLLKNSWRELLQDVVEGR